MYRGIYWRWYLKGFLDLLGVIPIVGGSCRESLLRINLESSIERAEHEPRI